MLNRQSTTKEDEEFSISRYQKLIDIMSGINYIIDRDHRIVIYTQEKWDDFASLNSGNDLLKPALIKSRSILDNFAGQKVKEYYRKIYDSIFDGKRSEITIQAKCDAPEVLRDNVIYLTPVYRDSEKKDEVIGILHQSLILKVEARQRSADLLKREREIGKNARFLEICSICKFIHYQTEDIEEWISTENYYQLGGTDDMKLDQSICDDCTMMLDEFL